MGSKAVTQAVMTCRRRPSRMRPPRSSRRGQLDAALLCSVRDQTTSAAGHTSQGCRRIRHRTARRRTAPRAEDRDERAVGRGRQEKSGDELRDRASLASMTARTTRGALFQRRKEENEKIAANRGLMPWHNSPVLWRFPVGRRAARSSTARRRRRSSGTTTRRTYRTGRT